MGSRTFCYVVMILLAIIILTLHLLIDVNQFIRSIKINQTNEDTIQKKKNVLLVSMHVGYFSEIPQIISQKEQFSMEHNMTYVDLRAYFEYYHMKYPKYTAEWFKLIGMYDLMKISIVKKDFDWFYWLDADVIITNFKCSPERFLINVSDTTNIIIAADHNLQISINNGVFLIRVCKWSLKFLENSFDLWSKVQKSNHFQDNTAMDIEIKRDPGPVNILPRSLFRQMQSYVTDRTYGGKQVLWEPGDCLLHFAGVPYKNEFLQACSLSEENCVEFINNKNFTDYTTNPQSRCSFISSLGYRNYTKIMF